MVESRAGEGKGDVGMFVSQWKNRGGRRKEEKR
jgi:hypothetical protein